VARKITVEVNAAIGRSMASVMQDFAGSMARGKAQVERDATAMTRTVVKQAKTGGDALGKSFDDAVRRGQKAYEQIQAMSARATAAEVADAQRASQAKVSAAQREFDAKLRLLEKEKASKERAREAENRAIQRDVERITREEARRERSAAQLEAAKAKARDREAAGFTSRFMGNVGGAASKAMDIGGRMAGGMGIKLDVSEFIGKGAKLEAQAADIANQASMSGQAMPAGEEKRLVGLARDTANKHALDSGDVMSVIAAFQAKSSDLVTAKAGLDDLSSLAKSSGTSFADMGNAAGMVNAQLEDLGGNPKQRLETLLSIMRLLTKQTANGTVEMSDLAKYVPRIAASANMFKGDYATNIGTLGAMAQMAIKSGRATPAEMTASAAAFGRDLRKDRTLKAFNKQEAGWTPFTDKTQKYLKPPEQLIIETLQKTKGNTAQIAKLYPNQTGAAAAMYAADVYNKAGGGNKGIDAVKAEFAKFKETLAASDVQAMEGRRLATDEAKIQLFNNRIEAIAASLAERLIPQFERLAPQVEEMIMAFAKVVGWAAENPGAAITTAIVGSIAKAAIGDAVGEILKNTLGKAATAGGGLAGLIGTAALAGITVGTMYAQVTNMKQGEGYKSAEEQMKFNESTIQKAEEERKKTGTVSPETLDALKTVRGELAKEAQRAANPTSYLSAVNPFGDHTFKERGEDLRYKAGASGIHYQEARADEILEAMKGIVPKDGLKVEVTNMPTAGGPMAPSDGREGMPAP
jgi:hypothetical protein